LSLVVRPTDGSVPTNADIFVIRKEGTHRFSTASGVTGAVDLATVPNA
jgi:hypothetical protein